MVWMQQVMILWYLLPPIFIGMMAVSLLVPRLRAQNKKRARSSGSQGMTAHSLKPAHASKIAHKP